MRPWLLLASLLFSEKRLLYGRMGPGGPEARTPAERCCMCAQQTCVHVAVQHKQGARPFKSGCNGHECSLDHQESMGIIHRNPTPALVIFLLPGEGKRSPAFLPALHAISEVSPSQGDGETSHIARGVIKYRPESGSAWFLHHHTVASSHNFQTSIVQLQNVLTKRRRTAAAGRVSCCIKSGEARSTLRRRKISKQKMVSLQIRPKNRAAQGTGKTSKDGFQAAAALRSGRPSVRTSDMSQLELQRNAVRVKKRNEDLDEEPNLRAASSAHDDGFDGNRQLSWPINIRRLQTAAARGDSKEDFSGKIITKLPPPEGGSEAGRSNITENVHEKRLAYIRGADFTHEARDNDADRKQGDVLIALFPPYRERATQPEPPPEKKRILSTDTRWKTQITPKEPDDPSSFAQEIWENFVSDPDNPECKRFRESRILLEIYTLDRTEGTDIKPAAEVTAASTVERVKEAKGEAEQTGANDTPQENINVTHRKPEENTPSQGSVSPSPPSLNTTEAAEQNAQTTGVNLETKETPNTEVFGQGRMQRVGEAPKTTRTPESEREPKFIGYNMNDIQETTVGSFSGLRMREDVQASGRPEGTGREERVATDAPETEHLNGPKRNSLTFLHPLQTTQKITRKLPKMSDDNTSLCGGLIHHTEAGRKHCEERFNRIRDIFPG